MTDSCERIQFEKSEDGLVELCEESSNNLLLCCLLALIPSNHFSGEPCKSKTLQRKQPLLHTLGYEKYYT